jgi:hypothetical protein
MVVSPFFSRFFRVVLIGPISDTIDVIVERTSCSDLFLSFFPPTFFFVRH